MGTHHHNFAHGAQPLCWCPDLEEHVLTQDCDTAKLVEARDSKLFYFQKFIDTALVELMVVCSNNSLHLWRMDHQELANKVSHRVSHGWLD